MGMRPGGGDNFSRENPENEQETETICVHQLGSARELQKYRISELAEKTP